MRSLTLTNTPSRCQTLSNAAVTPVASGPGTSKYAAAEEDPTSSSTAAAAVAAAAAKHRRPQKPDSSRPHQKNIRPSSSLSPATRNNPAASSSSSSCSSPVRPLRSSPSPAAVVTVNRYNSSSSNSNGNGYGKSDSCSRSVNSSSKPSAAQLRARVRVRATSKNPPPNRNTDNCADIRAKATAATTGPPTTTTGARRITAATTATNTTTTTTTTLETTKTSPSSPSTSPFTTTTTTTTTAAATAPPNTSAAAVVNPNTAATATTEAAEPTLSAASSPSTSAGSTASTPSSSAPTPLRRQQSTLSSSSRTPLRQRDQNVLNPARPANAARAKTSPASSPSPLSTPNTTASCKTTMPPYDKGASTTTRQSGMPSLGAKAMNRAPLTPKVAAKPAPTVTPLSRRRTENPTQNKQHLNIQSNAGGARDDLSSPAPFLSNNITPRSGSRQSRVNSANSTPNGTPNPDRNGDWDRQSALHSEPVRRQVVTFSNSSNVGTRQDANEPKFFYASGARDVKSSQAPPPPKSPVLAPTLRPSSFMYANGSAVERNRPNSPAVGFTPMLAPSLAPCSSPSLAPMLEPQSSKFFYANGAPELQPGFRPSSAASGAGSIVSGTGRRATRTSAGSANGFPIAQRPISPIKSAHSPTSVPLAKSNSSTSHTAARAQMTNPPPPAAASMHKRKISIDAVSQTASHVASEGPVTDAVIMSRFMAAQSPAPSELPSPTMSSFFPNQPITIASILQAAEDLDESLDDPSELDEVHSPSRSTHSDPLNDMVVNARRERKVQDLEITNASLEAINRSLERQLRKQTAELRRYKRLSRSGRLSVPSAPPSRVPSESASTTGGLGIGGLDLSDLSEQEEEVEADLGDLDDSMFDSSELSETEDGSVASHKSDPDRQARRRKRDEKRLQLDLTMHRELLVDSQKINQSIKKCLNWTEELIKEGKKALEYKIRPSDVELPPRVLQPKYLLEDDEGPKDDISIPSSPFGSPKSLGPHWSKEPQDRDSGIELPADGG